jgi:multicomponent Na+:H+ antiporter subunit E
MTKSAVTRAAGFLILWLVLAGLHPGDLPAAAVAVAAATWTSLRLLPPSGRRLSPAGIARLALRFPGQSAIAGVDVARRAFDLRLPLRPGFVTVSPLLPPGTARDAFRALASLLPGTLPVDATDDGRLLIHYLDTGQPVAAQMAADEALFARAAGGLPDHG